MGCLFSTPAGQFTPSEMTLIRQTWAEFKEGDIIENGSYIFFRLFRKNPESQDLFTLEETEPITEENYKTNKRFCHIVEKFLNMVESSVQHIEDLSDISTQLKELGARHHSYSVTIDMFPPFLDGVLFALERKLGPGLSKKKKKVWMKLFSFIEIHMTEGMLKQSRDLAKAYLRYY